MSAPSTASWPGAAGPKGPGWGSAMNGFKELSQGAKQDMANDKGLSMAKAKKMLKDNSAQGHPLTDKQKRLFGAIAGGNARKKY